MAEDNRWSVHLFTLNKAAVVSAPDKTVQVSVISQSAVGSSGGRFFINIRQRGKVPYMASRTLLAVCGKGMDSYDFILFRQFGQSRKIRRYGLIMSGSPVEII